MAQLRKAYVLCILTPLSTCALFHSLDIVSRLGSAKEGVCPLYVDFIVAMCTVALPGHHGTLKFELLLSAL